MVPEGSGCRFLVFLEETGIWDGAFLSIFPDCQGFEVQLQMWALSNS